MSGFVGADADALRGLAKDLGAGSGRVGEVALAVDLLLRGTTWRGPNRDAFEGVWVTAIRPALLACGDALDTAGSAVAFNADQQDAASAVADVGAGRAPVVAPAAFGAEGDGPGMNEPVPPMWRLSDLSSLTPAEIRAEWDKLTDTQKRSAIAANPLVLGNLDGIPLGWRANANEINLRNEIARLEAERDALTGRAQDGATSAFLSGLTGGNHPTEQQAQIEAIQAKIDYYQMLLGTAPYEEGDPTTWRTAYYDENGSRVGVGDPRRAGWPKGSQLLLFDPANQRIATHHGVFTPAGDIPAGYANVTTYTPGTGTQPWKWGDPDTRGAQLHVEANRSGNGAEAMIVWSDGPQPQFADAIFAKYAQGMGPKLVSFTDTYIPDGTTYTAIGHSYGATNVAQAEACGLNADRVMYIAGAGYGEAPLDMQSRTGEQFIRGLEDFPYTGDKPHYSVMAREDPVVGLAQDDHHGSLHPFDGRTDGIHGLSQTNDPDVTRLETGYLYDRPPTLDTHGLDRTAGYLDDNPNSHSTVFNYGSTSFNNIVEVITGGTAHGYSGPLHRDPSTPLNPYRAGDNYNEKDWPDVPID